LRRYFLLFGSFFGLNNQMPGIGQREHTFILLYLEKGFDKSI
jgi:hypothetical protein